MVAAALAAGTPGEDGMPCVASPEPASASRPSTWPWYAPANLIRRSRPVAARASRIALIDASVPEEVIRSISTDGMRWATSSARSTSAAVGAPNVVPRSAAACTASSTGAKRVAVDQRAPGADVVDVGVAVDVGDLRARRVVDEDRLAADRAHRADGRVDAAREDADGAAVELRGAGVGQ